MNSTLWIRSSDVFVGLPYDVMGHAMLMGLMASELDMRPGWLNVSLAHPHLYDVHRNMARVSLTKVFRRRPEVQVAGVSLGEVEEEPGVLVDLYGAAQKLATWPQFEPKPEVVK